MLLLQKVHLSACLHLREVSNLTTAAVFLPPVTSATMPSLTDLPPELLNVIATDVLTFDRPLLVLERPSREANVAALLVVNRCFRAAYAPIFLARNTLQVLHGWRGDASTADSKAHLAATKSRRSTVRREIGYRLATLPRLLITDLDPRTVWARSLRLALQHDDARPECITFRVARPPVPCQSPTSTFEQGGPVLAVLRRAKAGGAHAVALQAR